ncbi:MAG TPA: ABC transporter ATP-binding protein [Limnochordia bacterium]|nr:ABC transporter ATP-binding protein [Limnochordia bacterium]
MRSLWRVIRYFRPYRARLIMTIVLSLGSVGAAMMAPRLTKIAIDDGVSGGDLHTLWLAVLGIAAAYLGRDLLNAIRIRVNNRLEQQVIFDMRTELYDHLQGLSLRFYADRSSGELMNRVVEDVNNVERVLLDGTEQMVVALFTLLFAGAVMFSADPALAAVALVPIPFLAFGEVAYTRFMHAWQLAVRERAADMNALLHDNLAGLFQIKIFGRERHESRRFARKVDEYRSAQLRVMYFWGAYSSGTRFFTALGTVLVILVGGRQLILGQANVTIGTLFEFIGYLGLFYNPIDQLSNIKNLWQQALAAGQRVFEVIDTQPDIADAPDAQPLPSPVRGHVRFERVGFRYDERRTVLAEIELEAAPGEHVAIVGPTGAGKTTLVNLVPRFYDVTAGRVTIDGVDVRRIPLADLRAQIAVVSQEPFLFNGSIRENILYGRHDASDEELLEAARAANVHRFVERLPDGYDTLVGERGVKLSVGEKQRVSIARALLKDAPILILDEATSAVDTRTEAEIQEALDRLMAGRTAFVIAHRLSTVRNCDRIAVIDGNRIVQLGAHAELLAQPGIYAELHAVQSGAADLIELGETASS